MQARIFIFNGIELPDPDPSLTPDQVRQLYAAQYPALNNAIVVYPSAEGGNYEFAEKSKAGATKIEFKPNVGRKS